MRQGVPTSGALTVLACAEAVEDQLRSAKVAFGHGTTNAWDEAVYLVLHTLGLPLDDLSGVAQQRLTPGQSAAIGAVVDRRIEERMPAAYLTREAWLGNFRFAVDPRVIVPRSFIAELLRAPAAAGLPPLAVVRSALDLCSGSGCLAVLLALACPQAKVDAAELSVAALEVAQRNLAAYRLQRRIRLLRSDLFAALSGRRYDLIISNPPYVTDAAMRRLPAEYRCEPVQALAGGRDGLDFVRRILNSAVDHLSARGVLVLEVGHARARVERAFPKLRCRWPTTSGGDDCVLVVSRVALLRATDADAQPSPMRSASRPASVPRPPASRAARRARVAKVRKADRA